MNLLDQYTALRNDIFAYFGYVEDWRVIPIDDARGYFWRLDGEGRGGSVRFSETLQDMYNDEKSYVNEIYTQRHLPKWVYRGPEYTMIVVDTNVDSNQFLQIFDNSKEDKSIVMTKE